MEIKTMLQIIQMDLETLNKDVSRICQEIGSCKKCPLSRKREENDHNCILDELSYLNTLGLIQQKLRQLERKEKDD